MIRNHCCHSPQGEIFKADGEVIGGCGISRQAALYMLQCTGVSSLEPSREMRRTPQLHFQDERGAERCHPHYVCTHRAPHSLPVTWPESQSRIDYGRLHLHAHESGCLDKGEDGQAAASQGAAAATTTAAQQDSLHSFKAQLQNLKEQVTIEL